MVVILLTFASVNSFARGKGGSNGHSKGKVGEQAYNSSSSTKKQTQTGLDPLMEGGGKGYGNSTQPQPEDGTGFGSTSKLNRLDFQP